MQRRITWEAVVAVALLALYWLTRPIQRIPALPTGLNRSLEELVFDITVCSLAFGLCVSAAGRSLYGLAIGVVGGLVSLLIIIDWFRLLLF